MTERTKYTFNKKAVDRIARAVRWVEDFQMDEGDHTPTQGQNPAFETPLGSPSDNDDGTDATVTVVTGIELTAQGLVFKTRDVSSPYIEFTGTTDSVINTTQCEE